MPSRAAASFSRSVERHETYAGLVVLCERNCRGELQGVCRTQWMHAQHAPSEGPDAPVRLDFTPELSELAAATNMAP